VASSANKLSRVASSSAALACALAAALSTVRRTLPHTSTSQFTSSGNEYWLETEPEPLPPPTTAPVVDDTNVLPFWPRRERVTAGSSATVGEYSARAPAASARA